MSRMLLVLLCLAGGAGAGLAQSDAEIRALIDAAGGLDQNGGASLVKVFDRTDVDVEESGLSHIRSHVLTKILSDAGCVDLAALRHDYDPATNMVEVRKLRVHRATGAVEDADLNAFVDVPQPAHGIYWGMRMKITPVPRLQVGDAVEVETYKKGFLIAYLDAPAEGEDERYIPPMRGHYYDMILFEEGIPIKEKTYSVHTVRSRPLQYDVFNGECACATAFDDAKFHYTWSKRDMPAVHAEPRAPDSWDYVTKVVLATVGSWEEKSRWFEEVNRPQFDANPAIQGKVDEIVAGLPDDESKATALLRWVANNIRYSGLSMGKGEGFTLHPGWMIFEERAGVCKDIAGMLITMMRAAGMETYPAMTMAGARVEHVPADQFNHCVVARRLPGGAFKMYDPTWCPLSMTDWSLAEAEQHYVIGSPEGETLTSIPYHPPEDCLIRIGSEAALMPDGTLEGTMVFEGRAQSDTWLRRTLAFYNDRRSVEPAVEQWLLQVAPQAELVGFEAGDFRDLTRPVQIRVGYRVPRFGLALGHRIELASPSVPLMVGQLVRFESATRSPARTQPLFIYNAARHVVEETIRLPSGYALVHAGKACSKDNSAADLAASVTGGDGCVRVSCSMAVKRRSTPPELYPQLYEVMQDLRAFRDERIIVAR